MFWNTVLGFVSQQEASLKLTFLVANDNISSKGSIPVADDRKS